MKERLDNIKKTHLERIKQNEFYTATFIHVDWLIEQAEKVERYEKALKEIAEETGTPYAEIAEKALNS